MEIAVLASGSNGNCCLVEDKGSSVLIDAGKSGREIEKRMNSLGKSCENVDGILLTHAHSDHVQGAGILSRRFGTPVFLTKDIFSEARYKLGDFLRNTISGSFKVGNLDIQPIPTSHNVSSVGFKINNFGLFTDTGVVTKQMIDVFPKLKGVLLESNHDIDMVISGPYPIFLKNWILSEKGHLSNIHASELINNYGKNLDIALLGHLSGNNNTPDMAASTYESLVKHKTPYVVCSREKVSGTWEI